MQSLFPLLVLLALFAFTMSQNKKRQRAAAALAASLAPGVSVLTAGGIFGTVTSIDGDVVSIEIAPGTVIRMTKAAIGRVIDTPNASEPAALEAEPAEVSTSDEDRA